MNETIHTDKESQLKTVEKLYEINCNEKIKKFTLLNQYI